MRSVIFIAFVLLNFSPINLFSQIVNIPDSVFKDNLVNFPVADFDGDGIYESDVDLNDDGEIQTTEAQGVKGLRLVIIGITDLTGIEAFSTLNVLDCYFQSLTSLDMSQNLELKELRCGYNDLTYLDVSQNLNLEILKANGNDLASIDVSQNLNLIELELTSNELESLDVSSNQMLETLDVYVNNLTELDVTNQPLLKNLGFGSNQISSIDLSQNPNLESLGFDINILSTIDVSQNQLLTIFIASDNDLAQVDLSQNPNLTTIHCENNQLNYLNVNNGNNINFFDMLATGNPDLVCIQVDDVDYSNSQSCDGNQGWCKDEVATYSSFCELGVDYFEKEAMILFPNPVNDILFLKNQDGLYIDYVEVYDTLGRKVMESNEATEAIDVSNLTAGIYFLHITTDQGLVTKKVIKE